ncbi:MAG: SdpI family protein [Planctomycetota bacterium]
MSRKFANIVSLLLVAGAILASVLAYPNLPEQVPTHWNAAGEIDGYSGRLTAAIMGPALAAGILLLMWLIPVISPRGFRTDSFQNVVNVIQVMLVAFMVGMGGIILAAGFGHELSVETIVPIATGLLFIVLGNYMGKIRKNFFIGIRTPWTLASDEVWALTHRFGGYLFVIAGALLMVTPLIGLGIEVVVGASLFAGLGPVVYSFIAYRRIEGFGPDEDKLEEVPHE